MHARSMSHVAWSGGSARFGNLTHLVLALVAKGVGCRALGGAGVAACAPQETCSTGEWAQSDQADQGIRREIARKAAIFTLLCCLRVQGGPSKGGHATIHDTHEWCPSASSPPQLLASKPPLIRQQYTKRVLRCFYAPLSVEIERVSCRVLACEKCIQVPSKAQQNADI